MTDMSDAGCLILFRKNKIVYERYHPVSIKSIQLFYSAGRCFVPAGNLDRCGQPDQQHGLRIPSLSSEHTLSACCLLVSSFLTETVQHIHSLRANGVISSHFSFAAGSDARAFLKSSGNLCTVPAEIVFLAIVFCLTWSL